MESLTTNHFDVHNLSVVWLNFLLNKRSYKTYQGLKEGAVTFMWSGFIINFHTLEIYFLFGSFETDLNSFLWICLQKDLLARIRKENAKTDFEDRNCGRFRRIFPPQDRYQQERYAKLLLSAFNNLVVGKNASMAREIERQYLKKYRVSLISKRMAGIWAGALCITFHFSWVLRLF